MRAEQIRPAILPVIIQIVAAVWLVLLFGCSTPPIKVTPMVDVAAVRKQNEVTKKHIDNFTTQNRKTQTHAKKVQEEAIKGGDALQTAKKHLDELLGDEE